MLTSRPAFLGRSPLVLATIGLAVALMTGCGSGSSAGSAEAPAPTTPEAGVTTEAAGGLDACADAQPEIEAASQVSGFVTSVEVATCDLATITTTLTATPEDAQSAVGLCGNAANEASGHGVAAVSVVAEDGTELARGTDATDCAATL